MAVCSMMIFITNLNRAVTASMVLRTEVVSYPDQFRQRALANE